MKWFRRGTVALIALLALRAAMLWALGPWVNIIVECQYYPPPCPFITQPVPWWIKPLLKE